MKWLLPAGKTFLHETRIFFYHLPVYNPPSITALRPYIVLYTIRGKYMWINIHHRLRTHPTKTENKLEPQQISPSTTCRPAFIQASRNRTLPICRVLKSYLGTYTLFPSPQWPHHAISVSKSFQQICWLLTSYCNYLKVDIFHLSFL